MVLDMMTIMIIIYGISILDDYLIVGGEYID